MRTIVMVILMSFSSCFTLKEKQDCIDKIREKSKADELSQKVRNGLRDTMIDWANKGVPKYEDLKNNLQKYDFEEIVLFTKDSNRAYSCYYRTNKATSYFCQSISWYYAERKEGIWNYYCEIGTFMVFYEDLNNNKSFTNEQLKREFDKQLMKYLDVKNCRIDYPEDLINEAFRGGYLYDVKKEFWEKFIRNSKRKNKVDSK